MHVDRNYKTDFDIYYKMNGDRSKTNAGNSDWQKEQEEEVATAHTHPLVGPDGLANIGKGVRTSVI